MKICVIGTRGFPKIQGGIETHCEELYSRIANKFDCEVIVFRRTPYIKDGLSSYKNIRFIDIWIPRNKYLETFLHSLFSTVYTLFLKPDIAHYHNTGPGVFIPILKLFRIKVVFTYHNISYTQKKWNQASKFFLNFTERICFKFSDYFIFISDTIKDMMVERYKILDYEIIRNGVVKPSKATSSDYIDSLNLKRHKYIIGVGRFLEEKGFDYLIDSFKMAKVKDYKLVIAGDADYPTTYSLKLKNKALENDVVLTGFIKDEKLQQLFTFAQLYIMSSFEEGLPIALLEAMSYNLDVLASDIQPNLEIGLDADDYFEVGNSVELSRKITEKLENPKTRDFEKKISENYNWDNISNATYYLYTKLLKK